jgi:hypothetical protein
MTPAHRRALERRALILAAQRARRLCLWQEQFDNMARTPVRSDAERVAKAETLAAMERARPE